MAGFFDGERLKMEALHRFSNDPVFMGNTMYWDFLRLFHELKQGILKSKGLGRVDSMTALAWIHGG